MADDPAATGTQQQDQPNPPETAAQVHIEEAKPLEQVQESGPPQSHASANPNPTPTREQPKWTDKAVVVLTGGIVLAAILQTIIFWGQKREMHSAGEQTDKIISTADEVKSALIAANSQNLTAVDRTLKQNADALAQTLAQNQAQFQGTLGEMRKQNQTAREALENVQRAYVSFQGLEWERVQSTDFPVAMHAWELIAKFENGGATPAIHVVAAVSLWPLSGPPTEQEFKGDFKNFPITRIGTKAAARIKATAIPEIVIFGTDLGPTITADSTKETHFNRGLFVWGWLYYKDIFPKTKEHITEICAQITSARYIPSSTSENKVGFEDSQCHAHNCDDEQCEDYQEIVKIGRNPN